MLQLYPPPLSAARVAPPMPPPPPTPPPGPSSAAPTGQARWDIFPADPALPVELSEDMVRELLSHVTHISALRQSKLVCKAWQQQGRAMLTDVDWQLRNGVTLHSLIQKRNGLPSAQLVSKLAKARPELLNGRDHEGLLPLQYAAAYRKKDEELVSTLRTLTKGVVPGLPSMDKAAFFSKKAALRSVFTRVAHMPLMADDGP